MATVSNVVFLKPQPGRLEAFMRDLAKANNIIKRVGGKLRAWNPRCLVRMRQRSQWWSSIATGRITGPNASFFGVRFARAGNNPVDTLALQYGLG
jgi:hypothetical protein